MCPFPMKLSRPICRGGGGTRKLRGKRMFARGGSNCPVQTLRTFFFRRIDPQDNFFFNNGSKGAISSPQMTDVWYLANPCKQFQFCKFMPHIFKNSGCSRKYTTHCLCSTATQASNNERFEICYIIY